MSAQSCRICGCTDRFGCEERCYWIALDLCSVCSGATMRRLRSFTRTAAAMQRPDVPAGMLGIFNRVGRLLGLAWHISEAQTMARGIDAYYRALTRRADAALGRKRWRRGPIMRRYKAQKNTKWAAQ